jgi:hypothetical protein
LLARSTGRLLFGPSGTCDVESDLEPGYHLVPRSATHHPGRAAGGCVLTYQGADHTVARPRVVGRATAGPAYPRYERLALRLIGINEFVWLTDAANPWPHAIRLVGSAAGAPSAGVYQADPDREGPAS